MKLPKFKSPYLVKPGARVRLGKLPTEAKDGPDSSDAALPIVAKHRAKLAWFKAEPS